MMTTDQHIARAQKKVEAGVIKWTAVASLLRNRIMRLEEMIRPLPGYAQHAGHADYVAEKTRRIDELKALKARHSN